MVSIQPYTVQKRDVNVHRSKNSRHSPRNLYFHIGGCVFVFVYLNIVRDKGCVFVFVYLNIVKEKSTGLSQKLREC